MDSHGKLLSAWIWVIGSRSHSQWGLICVRACVSHGGASGWLQVWKLKLRWVSLLVLSLSITCLGRCSPAPWCCPMLVQLLVNSSLLYKSFADKTKIWVTALKIDSALGKLLKQALLSFEKAMSTQPHKDTPKKHSILPQRHCQFSTLA